MGEGGGGQLKVFNIPGALPIQELRESSLAFLVIQLTVPVHPPLLLKTK